jgi:hypothetical protein
MAMMSASDEVERLANLQDGGGVGAQSPGGGAPMAPFAETVPHKATSCCTTGSTG